MVTAKHASAMGGVTPRLALLAAPETVTAPWTQVRPEAMVWGTVVPAQLVIESPSEREPPELEPPELEPPELEKPAGGASTGDMHTKAEKPLPGLLAPQVKLEGRRAGGEGCDKAVWHALSM